MILLIYDHNHVTLVSMEQTSLIKVFYDPKIWSETFIFEDYCPSKKSSPKKSSLKIHEIRRKIKGEMIEKGCILLRKVLHRVVKATSDAVKRLPHHHVLDFVKELVELFDIDEKSSSFEQDGRPLIDAFLLKVKDCLSSYEGFVDSVAEKVDDSIDACLTGANVVIFYQLIDRFIKEMEDCSSEQESRSCKDQPVLIPIDDKEFE